jgi:hypothetical protein
VAERETEMDANMKAYGTDSWTEILQYWKANFGKSEQTMPSKENAPMRSTELAYSIPL